MNLLIAVEVTVVGGQWTATATGDSGGCGRSRYRGRRRVNTSSRGKYLLIDKDYL